MKRHLFLMALALSLGLAGQLGLAGLARADENFGESLGFRSPSDNIHCYYDEGDGDPWLRCDMAEGVQSYTSPPDDCELDWGMSFYVEGNGGSGLTCHGDTVRDPSAAVLGYGQELTIGSITCRSEKTGMTCRNTRGHGFSIAKAKQSLF